ncbi:MAG TPA: phosphoenolpyruvate--protein phosphotransferase [Dongiaceae bacterium]|jgi:phosphotransferase system enzyme I (PtsI)|nr:phosphoenolpyruvate--protein phosphotransferase [Dongiaceae bacterium]
MSIQRPERIFSGKVASPGLVSGRIRFHARRAESDAATGTPAEEASRLDQALSTAATQLARLSQTVDEAAQGILEFQIALIEDDELVEPVRRAIAAGSSAAKAWRQALDAQVSEYQAAPDSYFRARAADLVDLRDRVLDLLSGVAEESDHAGEGDEARIYVGEDLAPSRFLEIDWQNYRGGALLAGSANGHVAILARARGIPLIVGLGAADLVAGADAILDAEEGRLIQDPIRHTRDIFARRMTTRSATAAAEAEFLPRPAITAGGQRIAVAINVDEPGIVERVDASHCDGIGLTRTEFLFSAPGGWPDEGKQFEIYAGLIAWAKGRRVTIRTLDAGGDKPIPGLTPDGEANPFLGLRGIRLSLSRPDMFSVQLRALARAAATGPLKVMLPMVTVPREIEETRALFKTAIADLIKAGVKATMPSLGMMVEVPAAAINVAHFEVDFFSIGSNDLVQYVTATSRDNSAVAALHDPLDPAVLELIGRVVAHGAASGRDVGLCGDMASDARYLPKLLDLGLRSISVAPARLARIKAEIARHG